MSDPPSPLKKLMKEIERKQYGKYKRKIKISEDDPFTNIFIKDSQYKRKVKTQNSKKHLTKSVTPPYSIKLDQTKMEDSNNKDEESDLSSERGVVADGSWKNQ